MLTVRTIQSEQGFLTLKNFLYLHHWKFTMASIILEHDIKKMYTIRCHNLWTRLYQQTKSGLSFLQSEVCEMSPPPLGKIWPCALNFKLLFWSKKIRNIHYWHIWCKWDRYFIFLETLGVVRILSLPVISYISSQLPKVPNVDDLVVFSHNYVVQYFHITDDWINGFLFLT